jgi:hypothetical protein
MSDQVCTVQIYAIYTCASGIVVLIRHTLWLQGVLLTSIHIVYAQQSYAI